MNNVTINISEAKTNLSKYAQLVKKGKTIILAQRNIPFAQITPLADTSEHRVKRLKRLMGSLKGKVTITGDINEPLTKEELRDWYDGKM